MLPFCGASGSSVLDAIHKAQLHHPIRQVWAQGSLPTKLVEYVSAVGKELPSQVRQDAVLMLKRFACQAWSRESSHRSSCQVQVVALTCVHLAMKHWLRQGLPEAKLHRLSRNSFTRQDLIEGEAEVMHVLGGVVHWEGVLLGEWAQLLLYLASPLLAGDEYINILSGVAAHITDVLAFFDDIMSSHLPSELASAAMHAATLLCTKHFQRYAATRRMAHLARTSEEDMVQLSETILTACIGAKCAEFLLEGSGFTAEASDLESDDREDRSCGTKSSASACSSDSRPLPLPTRADQTSAPPGSDQKRRRR